MNLLLLTEGELRPDGTAELTGRRARHVREVHRAEVGRVLRVGLLGGLVGTGEVTALSRESVALRVTLSEPPPPRPGIDLLLAMPRPKVLKRLFECVASLGVGRLALLNAARVEKSYFDTPALEPVAIREHLLLGLEQGRDTQLPEVSVHARFRPFVEDELAALFPSRERWVADPGADRGFCCAGEEEGKGAARAGCVVAIGPEGGWVPFELDLLASVGFRSFSLGSRILRVETAVPFVIGQLVLARSALR